MEKKTKRKAFNFLRSYFDVINELENDNDKFDFVMSIINKQFLDEDPKDLNFIVNLCYQSQKHAIESSVKGWKRVNKTDMQGNPTTDPTTNPPLDIPTNPKEEKEEEEVKEKEEVEEENTLHDIDTLKKHYLSKEKVLNAVVNDKRNKVKNLQDLKDKLNLFCDDLNQQGRNSERWLEFTKYFINSLRIGKFDKKEVPVTHSRGFSL